MPIPAQSTYFTFTNGTTGTSALIQFTPAPTATGFTIYQAVNPFTTFTAGTSTANGTLWVNGLQNHTEYWFYIIGTNASGISLPSNIVNGLVYDNSFNYFDGAMQALQAAMKNSLTWAQGNIIIGDSYALPFTMPAIALILETNKDLNVSLGMGGKKDEIFSLRIRIYYSDMAQDNEETIRNITAYMGQVQWLLESLKQYTPYWYISDIGDIIYGKTVIAETILKYADILWTAKRRVVRTV